MASNSYDNDAVKAFWARYAQSVLRQSVPEAARPWCVRHARRFVESSPVRLRERTPELVKEYFNGLSHMPDRKPWQAAQIVHAVEILFREFVPSDWVTRFDWAG
jgi:hypothetical protein